MKKFFTCLLILTTLLTLSAPAYADIMWEPRSDRFYENHREKCEYNARSYYANGTEGFITLWDAPNGSMVKAQYENGEILWVGYTYQGKWALARYSRVLQEKSRARSQTSRPSSCLKHT